MRYNNETSGVPAGGNIINNNNINNFFIQNASVIEMIHDKLDTSVKA